MPNRIIHEKCVRSSTLASISAEAERLFWRLTVVADDQGRFDARPSSVKADCFRCMVDEIKTLHVTEWLLELAQAKCIRIYEIDEHPYGVFRKWKEYQRIYGNKAKFPEPPAEICGELRESAGNCGEFPQAAGKCGELRENPALILTPISIPISITTTTDHRPMIDEFEQFWDVYPKKVGKKAARQAWQKAKDKPTLVDILKVLELQKKSEQWTKDAGQFIPNPSTWLNQGRWADHVEPARKSLYEEFADRHKGGTSHGHGLRAVLPRVGLSDRPTVGPTLSRADRNDRGTTDDDQDPAGVVFQTHGPL